MSTVTADKAVTDNRGRMLAWSIESEGLVSLNKQVEGIIVTTYTFNANGTCSVAIRTEAEHATSRVIIRKQNGFASPIKDYSLASYTCTVKPGNIFNGFQ